MLPLTPIQLQCLPIIQDLVADLSWLPPSYVMAHVRIESGWDPTILAGDYASTGSVGLMQVTAATATQMGFSAADQQKPDVSLATGVAYIKWLRTYLMRKWGFTQSILYHPICEAYNEGPGNVVKGRQDPNYYLKWSAAQMGYSFVDGGK